MNNVNKAFKKNAVAAAVAASLIAAGSAHAVKPTNAQSLSFQLTSPQNFILSSEQFWAYDPSAAREYFTNTLVGPSSPFPTCSGSAANCAASNQPPTPEAPAPLPNRLNAPVNNNQCVFWDGGNLSVKNENKTYKQDLTVKGLNGSGNFKFEWNYAVAVKDGVNPVDMRGVGDNTTWILESETPASGVPIAVSGSLAGQSTQLMTGKNARFKTAHGLVDQFGAARLENAGIELLNGSGATTVLGMVELGLPGFPNYSVLQNENFYYAENAGSFNQPPGLLVREGWVNDIQNGFELATDGQTVDNFPGNDNQGGDRIVFGEDDPNNGVPLLLAEINQPGSYKVRLFGTLKGNPGEIDAGFEGTADVKVNSVCVAP